ncbi:unnamed protein product [Rotaria socialis]|uniref:Prolyl 4-hydroxylase peptide-substrate-binding domain-containing protein n=1 Tax=Rotaria socialis TaxID=392032 RepID=A0A821UXN5_9BILA|nr:unnamed protein product [Rotaria socialis]CAF4897303.1 unnamed protein product [Rotaria socialis]
MVSRDLSKIIGKKWLFPSLEDYNGESIIEHYAGLAHFILHIGIATSLLRLQDTYALNTSDECYGIGHLAFRKGDFYHALMWMQEALDRLNQDNNTASIIKIIILDNLAHVTSQQGNIEHALALTEQILSIGNQQYVRLL